MSRPIVDIQLSQETKRLLATLNKYAGFVSVYSSMKAIGISYRKEVKAIFERKQARSPDLKWKELSPAYKKQKDKKYPGKNILEKDGTLKKSMTILGSRGNIARITHTSGSFGSSIPYGIYHDDTESPRKKMPLRNFSLPSQTSYSSWLKILSADLSAQLRRIGVIVE